MFESAVLFWGWASITGCKLQQAKATGFRAQKNNYNEQTVLYYKLTSLPLHQVRYLHLVFFTKKKHIVSSYQQIQINNSNKICNIILMCFLNSSSHSAIFCVHRFLLLITFVRGRRWRHECAALRNKKCGEYVKVLSKLKNTTHTLKLVWTEECIEFLPVFFIVCFDSIVCVFVFFTFPLTLLFLPTTKKPGFLVLFC